ncbi:PEP-CTERM sorting domain-containing protein [Elusimicrobiota bacterium]
MKKYFIIALFLVGSFIPGNANAYTVDLIANGGFETGDFSGWNFIVDPVYAGDWAVLGNGSYQQGYIESGWANGLDHSITMSAYMGDYSAIGFQHSSANYHHLFQQDIYINPYATSAQLSLWDKNYQPHANSSWIDLNQDYTVKIMDSNTNEDLATVFSTDDSTVDGWDWTQRTFDLLPYAGQTIKFQIEMTIRNWWTYMFFDNVSILQTIPNDIVQELGLKGNIDGTPIPEPGTLYLLCIGLLAFGFMLMKDRNTIRRIIVLMKKQISLFILVIFCMAFSFTAAQAYVVDGMVDDWGVDLLSADDKGYLDSNLPSGGLNIDVITEDNADDSEGWQYVGPGQTYDGNQFDVEAIYFDNDRDYAYIAIVQGLGINGGTAPNNPILMPGDIAIDIDNNSETGAAGYELGISIADSHLYGVTEWDGVFYNQHSVANPWQISSGNDLGLVDFAYSGNQNSHYVLEARIPMSLLNLTYGDKHMLNIHWTQECGNDYLNLEADINPIPEPGSIMLLGVGILGIIGIRRFRKT